LFEQLGHRSAARCHQRHTDADRHMQKLRVIGQHIRQAQLASDRVSDLLCLMACVCRLGAQIIQGHQKLIAAQATKQVSPSGRGCQAVRQLDQQLISARMAQGVIEDIEAIDVDQNQYARPLA